MTTPRILWALVASAALISACAESPTAPSRMVASQKAGANITASFDASQLGHATVINTSDRPHTFTLIVWNANDEANQLDVAHSSQIVAPGGSAELTVGVHPIDPCVRYQRDVYIDLPAAGRYTLSDVRNYLLAAPGVFWGPLTTCRNPPDPPKPPVTPNPTCTNCQPPPVCSADAFVHREGHVDGDRIVETLIVKPEFAGITEYLVSWGAHTVRIGNGDLPLPQPQVHLTVMVLRAGRNIVTAPLASPNEFAGWQWEGGCQRPPDELTEDTLYSWEWLSTGWGNFEESR